MELIIVRHGETAWTISGQYTGVTELELTEHGRQQAARLHGVLGGMLSKTPSVVYTSPRQRAIDTRELALPEVPVIIDPRLAEYDYGIYEGQTFEQVISIRPGWNIWRDGCPGGESTGQVASRADAFLREHEGDLAGSVVVFSHGHFSRILTARALRIAPESGAWFASGPASISIIGEHHGQPCVELWNITADLIDGAVGVL